MSSMLEQAIIDAEALREVALKNAEGAVIEKYSAQIKEAVEEILTSSLNEEAEEIESDVIDAAPFAAADSHEHDEDCPCPGKDEEVVELDLTDLLTQMRSDEEAGVLEAADMQDREAIADAIMPEEIERDIEIEEQVLEGLLEQEVEINVEGFSSIVSEVLDDLAEEVKIDIAEPFLPKSGWSEMKPSLSGTEKYQEPLEKAIERVKETTKEHTQLKKKYKKLNETFNKVHQTLTKTNTANARLLYTNKVLTNSSLNERQKIKIVEALSKASSVEEAKIIFETLQGAVGTSANVKQPQSLSEAVTRNSSTYLPQAESKKEKSSPASTRWKILAGIKTN